MRQKSFLICYLIFSIFSIIKKWTFSFPEFVLEIFFNFREIILLVKFCERKREEEKLETLWKSSNFSDKASQGKWRISVFRKNKFEFLKNLIKLIPINRRRTVSQFSCVQFGSQVKLDFFETFYFSPFPDGKTKLCTKDKLKYHV